MRQIEFRGKSVKCDRWYYGNLQTNSINDTWISELDCGEGDRGFFENVKHGTVGQFTGLYDSKMKKIFEGDIVTFTRNVGNWQIPSTHRSLTTTHLVKWNEECCNFGLVNPGNIQKLRKHNNYVYEVIGNIIDTPELLNNI